MMQSAMRSLYREQQARRALLAIRLAASALVFSIQLPIAARVDAQSIDAIGVFGPARCSSGSCSVSCTSGIINPSGSLTYGTCTDGTSIPPNFTDSADLGMSAQGSGGTMTMDGQSASLWKTFEGDGSGGTLGYGGGISGYMSVWARVKPGATVQTTAQVSFSFATTGGASAAAGFRNACTVASVPGGTLTAGGATPTFTQTVSCPVTAGTTLLAGTNDYYIIDTLAVNGGTAVSASGTPNSANFNGSQIQYKFSVQGNVMQMGSPSGDGQTGLVNTALAQPLQVRVADGQTGQPVQGVTINFAVTSAPSGGGDATVSGSATTDANGNAATILTLGSAPGAYSVTAACGSCMANLTATFSATAETAQQATELLKVSGDGTGIVGMPLPNPLVVRAFNTVTQAGQQGIPVTFQSVAPATFLPPTTVATDGSGVASVSVTLPDAAGTYSVIAQCPDCGGQQSVSFSVTANGSQANVADTYPASSYVSSSGVNPAAPPTTAPGAPPGVNLAAPTVSFGQAPITGYGKSVTVCATVTPPSIATSVFYSSLQSGFRADDITPFFQMTGCNFPDRTIQVLSDESNPTCQTTDTITASFGGQIVGSVLATAVLPSEKAQYVSSGNDCSQFSFWKQILGKLFGGLQCPFDNYTLGFLSQYDTTVLPITESFDGTRQSIPGFPGVAMCTSPLLIGQTILTDGGGKIGDKNGQTVLAGGLLGFQVVPCTVQMVQQISVGSCPLQSNTLQQILTGTGTLETRRSDCDPTQPACKQILP